MIKFCHCCKREFKGRKERKHCSKQCWKSCSTWKENIGKGNKGKLKNREDFKKKMSEVTRGEKNPRWIPDRTKLKTKRAGIEKFLIEQWRKNVFARDDWTCQHCKKRGGKLNADHIKPVYLFPELIVDLSNGRTLCIECHKKTDTYSSKVFKLKRSDFE